MSNINEIIVNTKGIIEYIRNNLNCGIFLPYDNKTVLTISQYLTELAVEVRNKDKQLYEDLQDIKNRLFNANQLNLVQFGRLIQIMKIFDFDNINNFWKYAHPKIIEISKNKFEDGYYSDSVQTAIVEICSIIRDYRSKKGLQEIQSDKDMIYNTFSTTKILQFTDSSNISLKNIQEGYEKIFPGVVQAIRNPNAHKNNNIDKAEAVRKLMMISDLMYMLDKAFVNFNKEKTISEMYPQ